MNSIKKTWLFVLVMLALTLTACSGKTVAEAEAGKDGAGTEEVDPEAIFTSAAATVAAQLTETAISFSPTPAPATAIPTLLATATPIDLLPSPTGIGTATTLVPTAITPVPTATLGNGEICDAMLYGVPLDITIPDNTILKPGEDFYKIWRIQNNGICTWDEGYQLVVVSGKQTLDAANPAWQLLDGHVAPGEVVDVGAHLTAPLAETKGDDAYETCFLMQNDRGVYFGGYLCAKIRVRKD